MQEISLSMIVKNEAERLPRLLPKARRICEEMIVVDTGSTDNTIEVAKSLGAQVHIFPGEFTFGAARQYSMDLCTRPWMIWLDGDDDLPEETIQAILEFKQSEPPPEVLGLHCLYRMVTGHGSFRERIVRTGCGLRWQYSIHETLHVPPGNRRYRRDIVIQHTEAPHNMERNLQYLWKEYYSGNKHPHILYHLIQDLMLLKHYGAALDICKVFPVHLPQWPTYWVRIYWGRALMFLEQYDAANEQFNNACHFDPTRAEAWLESGNLYARRGFHRQALAQYSAALYLTEPEDGSLRQTQAYGWLPKASVGTTLLVLGCLDEAAKWMLHPQVIAKGNEDETVRKNINALLMALSKKEDTQ